MSTSSKANVTGSTSANDATPTYLTSSTSISSVPYAEEEMPSGASTPIAMRLPSRSVASCSLTIGGPSRTFLILYPRVSGISTALSRSRTR